VKRVLTIAVVLFVVVSLPNRCEAQYRPPRIIIRPQPPPPPGPAGKRYVEMEYPSPDKRAANLAELLGLTDEQRAKVKDIFAEQEKQSAELWSDDSLSIDARSKKLAEVRVGAVKRVREVLTDDQRKQYDALDPSRKPQDKPRLQPDPNAAR